MSRAFACVNTATICSTESLLFLTTNPFLFGTVSSDQTAWLGKPYFKVPEEQAAGYRGYAQFKDEPVDASVLGAERAVNFPPTGWALERNMLFTSHHDAPVAMPDPMRVISATVTRVTRSGQVLGPQHRTTPLVALKAHALWSAYPR
jgi:hypothetical protein